MKNQDPVLVFVPDLFFQSKIAATARATGASIRAVSSAPELVEECRARPGSIVFLDLSSGEEAIAVIESVKQDRKTGTSRVVGFYSHVDKDLERRARGAGCDLVLPKSAFSKNLPGLLTGTLTIG